MPGIEIRQIITKFDKRKFLLFPWKIYRGDPLWVPPILSDRKKTIDPKSGVFFQRGEAEFFAAYLNGEMVGTICTAVDHKANQAVNKKECVIGFFECEQDQRIAFALFDHAIQWAKDHNLVSLYGPFNLDYEDAYGILIEGRDRPPAILCGHTKKYYQGFFEAYGFQPARGDNLAYGRDLTLQTESLERIFSYAEIVRKRKKFVIRSADFQQWRREIDHVYQLINPCLQHLPGHTPWRKEALQDLLMPFVKIADPALILFAEKEQKPIGFFPAIPNFNEILIHANGFRYPWDYLLGWMHSKKTIRSAAIKSVLVLPEYWGSGVAILLFSEMVKKLKEKGYEWLDLSLTSADNPRMPALAERMGASIYKRYRVYRMKY